MSTVFPVLFIGLVLVALVGWVFAVTAAFQVWGRSAPGEKFGNYMRLGLLQFAYIEQRLGVSIRPVLVRYRNGLLIFLGCIIVAVVLTFIAASA
ncbi:MAG: hypothetical protein KF723_12230 [Rhizobiaceae bacterium]|nr:hypothetical protein [Rhizobiaceae bacterium]